MHSSWCAVSMPRPCTPAPRPICTALVSCRLNSCPSRLIGLLVYLLPNSLPPLIFHTGLMIPETPVRYPVGSCRWQDKAPLSRIVRVHGLYNPASVDLSPLLPSLLPSLGILSILWCFSVEVRLAFGMEQFQFQCVELASVLQKV